MLESLQAQTHSTFRNGSQPLIDENGRISLPGFPQGLAIESYLPLVNLYTRILEASRILDRYRDELRLNATGQNRDQSPLTALQPSAMLPHLYYKREDQTITRAYKVRGAVVGMAKAMESGGAGRFLAVSTGNHAMGVLKAAELLRPESVRIVVPDNTTFWKVQRIVKAVEGLNGQGVKADLVAAGQNFDQARTWATGQEKGEFYLDPYEDPWVVAGQGTLGLELVGQISRLLDAGRYEEVTVVSPIGGGGLLGGTSTALRMASAWEPAWRNVGLNLVGLTLNDYQAELGDAIRVKKMADGNRTVLDAWNVSLLGMGDPEMAEGLRFIKADLRETVEGASAGTLWPILNDAACRPKAQRLVISILSGANTSSVAG